MSAAKQQRQGDVLLVPVAILPEGERTNLTENGLVVLAHGEVTGHAHVIESAPAGTEYVEIGGERFLVLKESATLVHGRLMGTTVVPLEVPDHYAQILAPGIYHQPAQRGYEHGVVRQVVD